MYRHTHFIQTLQKNNGEANVLALPSPLKNKIKGTNLASIENPVSLATID